VRLRSHQTENIVRTRLRPRNRWPKPITPETSPSSSNPAGEHTNPTTLGERLLSSPRNHLPAVNHSSMLKVAGVLVSKMLKRGSPESQWSGRCCAVLILFSVCLLTIRVTTRFCFSDATPKQSVGRMSVVDVRLSQEHGRQRLIKDATSWKRPLIISTAWQAPAFHGCIAPKGPSLPGLLIHESLYNRPPPFLDNSSSLPRLG